MLGGNAGGGRSPETWDFQTFCLLNYKVLCIVCPVQELENS